MRACSNGHRSASRSDSAASNSRPASWSGAASAAAPAAMRAMRGEMRAIPACWAAATWARCRREVEDPVENVAMMGSEPAGTVAQRVEQLMQRREADLGFELHPGGAEHPHTGRLRPHRRRVQQRGPSHPWVAAQQQAGTEMAAPGKQRVDQFQFGRAPQ
jgi:hypothetical protein